MNTPTMSPKTVDILLGAPPEDSPLLLPSLLERFVDMHAAAGTMPSKEDDHNLFDGGTAIDDLETIIRAGFDDIDRAAAVLLAAIRTIGGAA